MPFVSGSLCPGATLGQSSKALTERLGAEKIGEEMPRGQSVADNLMPSKGLERASSAKSQRRQPARNSGGERDAALSTRPAAFLFLLERLSK